jgi:hypothetical protein
MIRAIAKGPEAERPPSRRRRFTVRDAAGIPIGHGRTPDEAVAEVARRGSGTIAWLEERDRNYPFAVWCRAPVGDHKEER